MEEINHIQQSKKPFSFWRLLKRTIATLVISIISIMGIGVSLVYMYEDDVKALIVKELNKHLNAEVRIDAKNIDLTIIKSFPHCALEFKNITVMESNNVKTKDTLLFAKKLALAFNVKDLWDKNYSIKKIELEDSKVTLKVDKKGRPNYLVWKTEAGQSANDSLKFALEKISLKTVALHYKNSKQKIKLISSIKKINFSGKFTDDNYLLSADGTAFLELFQIDKVKYVARKNLKLDIELNVSGNTYTIKKSETTFNSTQLISDGAFVVNDSLVSLDINFNGKNLDISSALSLLPEKFQSQINDYKSDGEFYAKGSCHYKIGSTLELKSEFGIKQATITYKPKNTTLTNVNLLGSVEINDKRSVLKLKNISANLNANSFSGDVEISHFEDPYLKLKMAANTKLEDLISFYPIDTLQELSGNLKVNAEIEGMINEMKLNVYSPSILANGNATIENLKTKFKHSDKEINIPEGEIKLNNRHLNVYNLKLIKGNSDVMLVGEMPNFLGYLFDSKAPFTIIASVFSDNIELEDFLYTTNSNTNSSVNFADNLDFNVDVSVKKLSFATFKANDISGKLLLKNQKIAVQDLMLTATDGTIKLNAIADGSGENINVSGNGALTKLNITKLFSQLNNFGQSVIQDKHLKGFVTANVDFSGTWDKKLNVDLNSINVSSTFLIERGELIELKALESLAKYIDVNELRHIKFSSLESAIDIKNKVITIPKTSIKSTALNLEFWGKHTFENQIDYHIQLLLSEWLAKKPRANKKIDDELSLVENDPENRRSVFIVMTGTVDNPIPKYDRKGAKEKIKNDIKQEAKNFKQILKDEWGLFKKDTLLKKKEEKKSDQQFQIKVGEEDNSKKKSTPLQPKKKEEVDEDF